MGIKIKKGPVKSVFFASDAAGKLNIFGHDSDPLGMDGQFSGSLPWDFSVWRGLSRLNLASNNLSRPLPDSLKTLNRQGSLLLHNNSFTGAFPPLDLPKLVYFNVSYNNLSGPVPDSLRKFYPDSFLGNQISCGSCTKKSHLQKN
ncbi:hypothetical protein SUGI_0633930 [Cryptomeria japonica]|nr:hypothetical protein SUGI_0633930 [Cryptomeria japonica]